MKSHSAADARPNQAKKSSTGSLQPAVPLAITPTFRPWTHTSDDSYMYQLSLVVATATLSYYLRNSKIKGIPHPDSTNEKGQHKNSAFAQFKYVAEGKYNRDEQSPIVRAKDTCTASCVRSERGACTAKSVSAFMGGAGTVVRVC